MAEEPGERQQVDIMSAAKTLGQRHRFELLDALRGIGAIFIAAMHTPPSMQKLMPSHTSYLAVDLFFCLSGFVIAFSYEDRIIRGMSVGRFLLLRVIRLYPLYLLGLLLGLLAFLCRNYMLPLSQRTGSEMAISFFLGIFMLPSLLHKTVTTNAFPFNPPSWSLIFEMGINLVYAGALAVRRAGTVLLFCVALFAFAVTQYFVTFHTHQFSVGWSADWKFFLGIPRVTYSFFLGVVLFRLFRAFPTLRVPDQHHRLTGIAIAFATIFILGSPFSFSENLSVQAATTGIILPLLIFLGAGIHLNPTARKYSLILGDISYPLYILHLPLLSPLYFLQKLHIRGWAYQTLAPLSVLVLVFVADWVGVHYDVPVRNRLTRWLAPPREQVPKPLVRQPKVAAWVAKAHERSSTLSAHLRSAARASMHW